MLRLTSADRDEHELLLPGGASIIFRRADYATRAAAEAAVGDATADLIAGREVLEDLGIKVQADLDSDDELVCGLGAYLMAVELGERCIKRWSGIGDAEGTPVEPSRTTIKLLLADAKIATRFVAAVLADLHAIDAEGNASAGSPSGAGTPAGNTAPIAESSRSAVH